MSKYFVSVKSLADLKNQYRTLALANHPDRGGDEEAMKAINAEYDALYPIWFNKIPEEARPTQKSGEESRTWFYTQYGWAGERYNSHLTTKEIAAKVREYVKTQWPQWKFHVKRETYSGGATIYLHLAGGPCPCPIISDDEYDRKWGVSFSYRSTESSLVTELANQVMLDAVAYLTSYRYDDSDGMIDYFSTNFYTDCKVCGTNEWTEIHRTPRIKEHKRAGRATAETKSLDAPEMPSSGEITDEMRYIAERTCLKAQIRDLKRQLRALDKQYGKK